MTDAKGRPVMNWTFADGQRQGEWAWFNADGTTRKQVTYDGGRIASDVIATSGKENVRVVAKYLEGRELVNSVTWHTRGRKKSEGKTLKPLEVTSFDVDWWAGNVSTEVVDTQGENARHGEWRFWHANGKLQMQGSYDHGREVGPFVWFYENGHRFPPA